MKLNPDTLKPESIAAQALGWIDEATRAITPPIHVSSTYLRDDDNQYRSGRVYARADNPAFDQAEAVLATLENGAQVPCLRLAWRLPRRCSRRWHRATTCWPPR